MEKIDRLGWAAGLSFTAYGRRVGIRVSDPSIFGSVLGLLPPGWGPASSPLVHRLYSLVVGGPGPRAGTRRYNLLYENAALLARTMDLDAVLDTLQGNLHRYVAEFARGRIFVHAGVVGWHGQAIVLPGRSFAGKSTLVAALVKAGATYYSDEYAVFDLRGRAHPFRRPLSLRGAPDERPRTYSAAELGAPRTGKPLPVGLVALTKYRSSARWRPRPLSPGRAVLALLSNTVPARRRPEVALQTLQRAVIGALVIESARGEAETVAESILHLADSGTSGSVQDRA